MRLLGEEVRTVQWEKHLRSSAEDLGHLCVGWRRKSRRQRATKRSHRYEGNYEGRVSGHVFWSRPWDNDSWFSDLLEKCSWKNWGGNRKETKQVHDSRQSLNSRLIPGERLEGWIATQNFSLLNANKLDLYSPWAYLSKPVPWAYWLPRTFCSLQKGCGCVQAGLKV